MKIVLIHGDNRTKAQERVRAIVDGVHKKGWKVERLDKNANLGEVFMSNTLLPETKLCIYEGVSNIKKEQIEWLKNNHDKIDGSFLLVNNGDAPKRVLQPISKLITEEHFGYPKILFNFLEAIAPGRDKQALKLFHELIETESVELVLAMMGRHFRDLYLAKHYPESISGPDWRKKKLISQANIFPQGKIEDLINKLAIADHGSKSGGPDLLTSLDVLLVRELSQ